MNTDNKIKYWKNELEAMQGHNIPCRAVVRNHIQTMISDLKELKEQQAEQIRLNEKTLDITTDQLMGVQAERNELKKEPKGLRWVNCYNSVPTITKWYTIRNWITNSFSASVYCDSKDSIQNYCNLHKLDFPEIQWLEETRPSEEAAQNVKP